MDFYYPVNNRQELVIKSEIPVLSFFTGAGFLDIGFKRAGFNIVWRNEVDPVFIKNHEHGMELFTGSTIEAKIDAPKSIEELTPNDILTQAFHNTEKPEVFGIIGGPPCPDFSAGGKNRGREGDHGKLLKTFIERISQIQPTFFLVENVLGLVRTAKHRAFLSEVLNSIADKYAISISMLNSLEFAVAQDRYRIFIVGFLRKWLRQNFDNGVANNGIEWKEVIHRINGKVLHDQRRYDQNKNNQPPLFPNSDWFPWPVDYRFKDAKVNFPWPSTSPFGGNPDKLAGAPEELMVGPLICNQNEILSLANGDEGFNPHCEKFTIIDEGDVSGKSFKRLHRWRYSPTAAYGNNEVHLHPCEARRLTIREAFRIQSVPDSYSFPADTSLTSKFKMIGNGVPVRLAEAVGLSLAYALKGNFSHPLVLSDYAT